MWRPGKAVFDSDWCCPSALLFLLLSAPVSTDETTDEVPPAQLSGSGERQLIGGPTDVPATLEENQRRKASAFSWPSVDRMLEPWLQWKASLNERYGFNLGTDYQVLYSQAVDRRRLMGDPSPGPLVLFGLPKKAL